MEFKITEFVKKKPKNKHINPPILTAVHGIRFNTWLKQNSVKKKKNFRSGACPKLSLTDAAGKVSLNCSAHLTLLPQ